MSVKSCTLAGALAMLLVTKAVADNQCVLNPNPPAGMNCGLRGYLSNENSAMYDLFDPKYLTPEGCAAGCSETPTCASFYFGDSSYPFCEYHSDITKNAGVYADSSSFYFAYDEACFTCGPKTVSCPASDGQQYTVGAATFDIHCSTDYYGGDLSHSTQDTFEDCMSSCASTMGCEAVAYNGNMCYLKNSVQSPRSDSNVWGAVLHSAVVPVLSCPGNDGAVYTAASGEQFQVQCGADYYGNDLTAPYVNNLNECLDDCGSTSGCVGVTLHGNYCYMKSALSTPQQNSDVVGAQLVGRGFKREEASTPYTQTLTPGLNSRRRRDVPMTSKLTPGLPGN